MIYLATASSHEITQAMATNQLGQLVTPRSGDKIIPTTKWALDNGCFSPNWNQDKWIKGLHKYAGIPNCLFAVVPDVVGNADATNKLWDKWADYVKQAGYKPAYVTQNGCTAIPDNAEAIFTGGDNTWKLGPQAQQLVTQAKAKGLWCHMGRVNSWKRMRYATESGYDSVDGTYLAFGPNKNLPDVLTWVRRANTERSFL